MLSDSDTALPSNGESAIRSNGASLVKPSQAVATNGARKSAKALNGSSNGANSSAADGDRPSDYFGHNREEVTRLLIQALSDMGYRDAADSVSKDSGYELESPTVAALRTAVLSGAWPEAEDLLLHAVESEGHGDGGNGLVLAAGSDRDGMRFWVRQQKYLELLEQRDTNRALAVLRSELTPLNNDTSKLHFLSSLLMCHSPEDLRDKANWDGADGESRKILLSELSSKSLPSTAISLPSCRPKSKCS